MKRKLNRMMLRLRPISVLMVAGLFLLNSAVAVAVLSPARHEIAIGDVATETIFAPRTIEDENTTNALKQAARNSVATVYRLDETLVAQLTDNATAFFTAIKAFRTEAQSFVAVPPESSATPDPGQAESAQRDAKTWQSLIPQDQLLAMLRKLPVTIVDTAIGYGTLAASDDEILRLEETVVTKLRQRLSAGVSETNVAAIRAELSRELQITTLPVVLKSLGEIALDAYFRASNVEDTTETMRAREKAAAAVKPVYITRGTAIVENGQVVKAEQMAILTSLDLVRGVEENSLLTLGTFGGLLIAYILFISYMLCFEKETFADTKTMLLLTIILGITILLEWVCYLLDPRITPVTLAVILTAVLISPRIGRVVNLLLAVTLGALAGGSGSDMLGPEAILTVLSAIAAGEVIVMIVRRNARRSSLIVAGAVGALAGTAVILTCSAMLGLAWREIVVFAGCTVACPLILSVFAVGTLSLWENAFDIVTAPRLHELLNANHPLLKKMMTAAPGTYHHSMMTAALAEGAAEMIDANAMLARAGATYHDVGKLRRPMYFAENQKGKNIHDTLPPEESASIIIAHQRDAEPLLARYKMPAAIRQIAFEHHGNTMVAYFFYKAKQQSDGSPVTERLYRYPGALPSTKESAIVMLADSCEAAVRSMTDPTRDQIADMVKKIIQGKMDDGQLAQSPLTLAEISRIERSFNITFNGLLHERIKYPGEDEK